MENQLNSQLMEIRTVLALNNSEKCKKDEVMENSLQQMNFTLARMEFWVIFEIHDFFRNTN